MSYMVIAIVIAFVIIVWISKRGRYRGVAVAKAEAKRVLEERVGTEYRLNQLISALQKAKHDDEEARVLILDLCKFRDSIKHAGHSW